MKSIIKFKSKISGEFQGKRYIGYRVVCEEVADDGTIAGVQIYKCTQDFYDIKGFPANPVVLLFDKYTRVIDCKEVK